MPPPQGGAFHFDTDGRGQGRGYTWAIDHQGAFALAVVNLQAEQSISAEAGAMVSMSGNIDLISQGIEPKNLVAAGFGEFQPLEVRTGLKADGKENSMDIEKSMARNRRIEFRLDQR